MSERIKGFVVVLGADLKDEDAEQVQAALSLIKGVIRVDPVPSNPSDWIEESRVRNELAGKLLDVLYPKASKG